MKKTLLVIGIAISSIQFAPAQKALYTELPNRLFNQGKEMYLDNNYTGAVHSLEEFKTSAKDVKLVEEAEYMIISSLYYQGKQDAMNRLKAYLDEYPASYHRNQVAFFIGSNHFSNKEWEKAVFWLGQSDVNYLSINEQEDHAYRAAYSALQAGDTNLSEFLFAQLARTSKKYKEPASYYQAYINFNKGKYEEALPIFRSLKTKSQYQEKASFFIIQGTFTEGNLSEVISEGQQYLSAYPNSDNKPEVYRLLGNSYYRTGNTNEAINNYERYVKSQANPIREDMYQLAEAYYRSGQYTETVNTLKKVASGNDLLGQAGNMLLGQAYLQMDNTAGALLAFDAASRSTFSAAISEEALYNYVMLTNRSAAVSTFGESITALQNFLTRYPSSKYSSEVNKTLANTLLSVKNYPMALSAIEKIKNPDRQILDAKQVILYQLGVQQAVDGKYNTAVERLSAAINMGSYNIESKNEAYFWRGDSYYRMGNYSAAATDYSTYVRVASSSNENFALAYYNLGYAKYQQGDHNAALANFKQYISKEGNRNVPTYSDALNRIGDCYLFNRNFSEAEKNYASAVSSNPSNADYSEFQKAFVLGLQRNYSGKVSSLDNMMSKYPESPYYENALFEKSRALVMMNKEKEAINVLEKLFKEHPNTNLAPKAGIQLGQLYFNINNPQKSIASYKKVVAGYPNTVEARMAINSMEGVYKDMNDINSYASYLKSLGKGNILSASRQDSLTYLAAENVYMKEQKTEAKTAFASYLRTYPQGVFSSDAHFFLGNMAFDAKDKVSALSHFREVITSKNAKYLDDALIFASGIEFDNKDYDTAYKTYEQLSTSAISGENKNVGELGMLRCAFLTNKDKEVVEAANKLMKNTKLSEEIATEAMFYRGRSLSKLGNKDKAISDLKSVAKNTRTAFGAESQYILAEIYYNQKQYDKVKSQVGEFMKAGTTHEYWMAKAIIVLADTHKDTGDNFQARQYLESLQANYKGGEEDIKTVVASKLSKLGN